MDTASPLGTDAPRWVASFQHLRGEMDRWIAHGVERQRPVPFSGGHDEGSFLASWLCHYQLTRDPTILKFARQLRDQFAAWAADHLLHGFYPQGEVHHQTELHNCFLLRLWHVAPDERTAGLILDAAEHIGNWVPGVPPWFDWDTNQFLGYHIGTACPQDPETMPFEVPDHFRLAQLALGAHVVSGDARYLELCTRWARRWATAILDSEGTLPITLPECGRSEPTAAAGGLGAAPRTLAVEPYVAAGAVDVLLDLYCLTGEAIWANASRVLCALLVEEVADPYANAAAALLHRYRVTVKDTTFDAQIMGAVAGAATDPPGPPAMVLDQVAPPVVPGIGRRRDMVRWYCRDEGGNLIPDQRPSPAALMLAYQIGGSTGLAARSMEMAGTRLTLAIDALQDGREHGCGGRSIAAVASGNGREGGYGNVTGCFYALAHGALRFVGQERPAVTLTPGEGGLPPDAAALTRSTPELPITALVWYGGEVWTVEADSAAPATGA